MSTYKHMDALWWSAVQQLATAPIVQSRVGPTREMVGYSAVLTDITAAWLWNPRRGAKPSYASAELLWYLSGTPNIEHLVRHAPSYIKFGREAIDGSMHADGSYGARWALQGGLANIVELLRRDPNSRQAVLITWGFDQLAININKGSLDVPCTLALQFLLRDGKLHLVATMRSNDVWLGMPYDVWAFTSIQRIVADIMGVGYGNYYHQVGSLHMYDKDMATYINRWEVREQSANWGGQREYLKSSDYDLARAVAEWEDIHQEEQTFYSNAGRTLLEEAVQLAESDLRHVKSIIEDKRLWPLVKHRSEYMERRQGDRRGE